MLDVVPLCCDNPCMFPSLPGPVKWMVTAQCTWGSGGVPHCHTDNLRQKCNLCRKTSSLSIKTRKALKF